MDSPGAFGKTIAARSDALPPRLPQLRRIDRQFERRELDAQRFSTPAIIALYFRRWAVETQYRDEKTSLDIESFNSHTENGIRQELFAILIVAVIARTLMVMMTDRDHPSGR